MNVTGKLRDRKYLLFSRCGMKSTCWMVHNPCKIPHIQLINLFLTLFLDYNGEK